MKFMIFFPLFFTTTVFANPWGDIAREDLESVYAALKADHPGAIDDQNPLFKKYLEEGLVSAKNDCKNVNNYDDYEAVISKYIAGFKDEHLQLNYALVKNWTEWPGFILQKIGTRYQVVDVVPLGANGSPGLNWVLISCDGDTPNVIMEKQVFPFNTGGDFLEAYWYRNSIELLSGPENFLKRHYEICIFNNGTEEIAIPLKYRAIATEVIRVKFRKLLRGQPEFDWNPFGNDGVWISLPTFGPDGKDLEIMKKYIEKAKIIRDKKYIVFDLRGNGGGSATWGDSLLSNLVGSEYFKRLTEADAGRRYAEYRVSQNNLAALRRILQDIKDTIGEDSDPYKGLSKVFLRLEDALKNGKAYVRQNDLETVENTAAAKFGDKPDSQAHIIALTDYSCVSACLDFMDDLMLLPKFTHIGMATGADTTYLEAWGYREFPSHLGSINFATKVWRNRKRGNNANYSPKYSYPGIITDTKGIKKWLLDTVIPQIKQEENGTN